MMMRPVFERAKKNPQRMVYAEGEEPKVLRAVQSILDEGVALPIVIGRSEVIQSRITQMGLRMRVGDDIEVLDPITDEECKRILAEAGNERNSNTINTLIAAKML